MINKVILVGNLGKDPDLKETKSGHKVCKFVVATTYQYKDREGDRQEKTEWHNCEAWGLLADVCGKYLTKGRQVYVEGRLQHDKVEDAASGTTRYWTKIIVEQMKMLGKKPSSGDQPAASNDSGPTDEVPF